MCACARYPRTGPNLIYWSEKLLRIISNIDTEGRGSRCSKDNNVHLGQVYRNRTKCNVLVLKNVKNNEKPNGDANI